MKVKFRCFFKITRFFFFNHFRLIQPYLLQVILTSLFSSSIRFHQRDTTKEERERERKWFSTKKYSLSPFLNVVFCFSVILALSRYLYSLSLSLSLSLSYQSSARRIKAYWSQAFGHSKTDISSLVSFSDRQFLPVSQMKLLFLFTGKSFYSWWCDDKHLVSILSSLFSSLPRVGGQCQRGQIVNIERKQTLSGYRWNSWNVMQCSCTSVKGTDPRWFSQSQSFEGISSSRLLEITKSIEPRPKSKSSGNYLFFFTAITTLSSILVSSRCWYLRGWHRRSSSNGNGKNTNSCFFFIVQINRCLFLFL